MADFNYYYPFDSVNGDRAVTAAVERRFMNNLFGDGCIGSNPFALSVTSGGVYSIATGACVIAGATGGTTAAQSITAQPAAGAFTYIVARLDTRAGQRKMSLTTTATPYTSTIAQLEQGERRDLILYRVTNDNGTYEVTDMRVYATTFDNAAYDARFNDKLDEIDDAVDAKLDEVDTEINGVFGSAGRQGFINPSFAINQRGQAAYSLTTGTVAIHDHWLARIGGRTASSDVVFQTVQVGERNCIAITNKTYSGSSGQGASCLLQNIERGVRTFCQNSKQFTVSFDAISDVIGARLAIEPVQYPSANATPVTIQSQLVTLTTQWARYSVTFTGTADAPVNTYEDWLKIGFYFAWVNYTERFGSVQNANNTVMIANVQINEGNQALKCWIPPYASDLAACERYYKKFSGLVLNVGAQNTSTLAYATSALPLPCSMAEAPTVTTKDRNGNAGASIELTSGVWRDARPVSVSSYGLSNPALVITGQGTEAATRAVFSEVVADAENMTR